MITNASKVILITGAGSSSLVGLKTLKSIVEGIQGVQVPLNDQDPSVELVKYTWTVIKGQKGDKATLEDLLAKLKQYSVVADLIKNDPVFKEELRVDLSYVFSGQFKTKLGSALAFCFRLMLDNYGPHRVLTDCDGYRTIHKAFKLLAQANGNYLHVFTTNYDCVLNVMADTLKDINFFSHINNKNGTFDNEWFAIKEATFKETNPNIYLHRLHGCIAWFSDPRTPYGVHEVFGAASNLIIEDPNKLNQMAIKLVSDESSGNIPTTRIGNIPAFSLAFQELNNELEVCDKLLVWGHSFRDIELLRCIINILAKRKNNPFDVGYIDPYFTDDQIKEHIRDTTAGVPIPFNILKPKNIGWVVQDGLNSLLLKIGKFLKH